MPLPRPEGRPATALVRRVFIGLLVANLAVVAAKSFVGLRAGSLAILGSALDSSVDALNNVLALIVVRVAAKEPDEDHPYGHGKFETLGALAIVGFLSITCFELIRGAVNELLQGAHPVGVTDSQLAVLVLTLGVNVVIAWYENRRGRELRSELLVADAAHTRADALITVGVLAGVDRKSTRVNSSHSQISYAVFCLKKKKEHDYLSLHFGLLSLDIIVVLHHSSLFTYRVLLQDLCRRLQESSSRVYVAAYDVIVHGDTSKLHYVHVTNTRVHKNSTASPSLRFCCYETYTKAPDISTLTVLPIVVFTTSHDHTLLLPPTVVPVTPLSIAFVLFSDQ